MLQILISNKNFHREFNQRNHDEKIRKTIVETNEDDENDEKKKKLLKCMHIKQNIKKIIHFIDVH